MQSDIANETGLKNFAFWACKALRVHAEARAAEVAASKPVSSNNVAELLALHASAYALTRVALKGSIDIATPSEVIPLGSTLLKEYGALLTAEYPEFSHLIIKARAYGERGA